MASGVAWAMKSSTPACSAIALAVSGLSPVTMTVRRPISRSRSNRSRMPGLRMSSSFTTPTMPAVLGDDQSGCAAAGGDRVDLRLESAGHGPSPCCRRTCADGVGRPLADRAAVGQVDAAHPRLGGERSTTALRRAAPSRRPSRCVARSRMLLPSGVSSATLEASAARPRRAPRRRPAGRTASPAVADRDRARSCRAAACRCRRPPRPPCRSWR